MLRKLKSMKAMKYNQKTNFKLIVYGDLLRKYLYAIRYAKYTKQCDSKQNQKIPEEEEENNYKYKRN